MKQDVSLPNSLLPSPASPAPARGPREPTVVSTTARFLVDVAARHDPHRIAALCSAARLDPLALADPDGRLPRSAVLRLVELLARQTSGTRLVLRAFEQVHPDVFQVVGFAMMSSTTLRQALQRAVRLAPVLDETLTLALQRDDAGCRLVVDNAGEPLPPLMVETGLASLLGFCRFLSGGRGLPVLQADFNYPAPADLSALQRVLPGARLRFDQPGVSLLLDADALDEPLRPVSPALEQMHMGLADQRLEALRIHQLVSARVQQFIVRHLRERAPTLEEAAAALLMSPRSLQRQLTREGRPFKQLLDDTRRQLAHQYLRYSPVTLKELAYLLGFGELGSLHRACLRWFGESPARYRARGGGAG